MTLLLNLAGCAGYGTPNGVQANDATKQPTSRSRKHNADTAAATSPLQITTSSLPGGQVQASYSATLAATGGTLSYTWGVVAGSLPPGLALGGSTGVIAGVPSASGQYSFTVQVTDSASPSQSATKAFSFSIAAAAAATSPLQITTSSLPGGQVQASYSAALAATGGTQPYSWSVVSGSLPPGLALGASSGVIAGVPGASGQYSFTVQVTDPGSSPQSARQTFTISIAAHAPSPLQITTSNLPGGQVQASYSATLAATGGTLSYTWGVVAGSLPPGLALSGSTGVIAGVPSASGQYSFTVQVTDSASPSQNATKAFSFSIAAAAAATSPLQITTSSLPGGQVQASYSATLAATGGTLSYTWGVVAGSLPPGLALGGSTGVIAGVPSASGQYSFTVQVTDSASPSQNATKAFGFSIAAPAPSPLQITPAAGGVFCGGTNGVATLPNCDPNSPNANTVFDTTMPDTSAYGVVQVNSGGDLQGAINNASCGTVIKLQAGSTFAGQFNLPNKTCAAGQWIIIQSDSGSIPAPGTRVSPTDAANMPKIQATGGLPSITVSQGANHYRFIGVEFNVASATDTFIVIQLNSVDPNTGNLTGLSDHIIFDRCYIHGNADGNAHQYTHGIDVGANFFAVIDSYLNQFHDTGADSQTMFFRGVNASGPFKIVNNYLSAAGENVMFGGASGSVSGAIPSDIEIRHNHFFKPTVWRGTTPSIVVKNLFELKDAQRVLIDGNVFENTWVQAQDFALVWTPSADSGLPAVVRDVTFTHNIVRHAANGMAMANNGSGAQNAARVLFQNNLFVDINSSTWGTGDRGWYMENSFASDIAHDHNTALEFGPTIGAAYIFYSGGGAGTFGGTFQFTNNLINHSAMGFQDVDRGLGEGLPTLNSYVPNRVWAQDALINNTDLSSIYPSGTYFPTASQVQFADYTTCNNGSNPANCVLLSSSPYHNAGTDGKDLGADIASITSATSGVIQVHD